MKKNRKQKFQVLDLFSGAGGLSLGFKMQGNFNVVAAFDYWETACNTFRFNNPKVKVFNEDLSLLVKDSSSKPREIISSLGEIDIVLGGPPCQGMSLAGKRLSDDPRNHLFQAFVNVVSIVRPRVFVMENVVGLITMNGGKIKEAIIKSFREIGYKFISHDDPTILQSELYGVPQLRRRVFFVGLREDYSSNIFSSIWPPKAECDAFTDANRSDRGGLFGAKLAPTVHEAICDLPALKSGEGSDQMPYSLSQTSNLSNFQQLMRDWSDCPYEYEAPMFYNHEAPKHTAKLIAMIEKAQPGQSVDPNYADSRKWDPDFPSFTIKALGAGGGSTNRRPFHYDPQTPRGSTVRENARIQSFPDWYRFLGPKTHQMTQVGNAVPPLLARAIANVIGGGLNNEDQL